MRHRFRYAHRSSSSMGPWLLALALVAGCERGSAPPKGDPPATPGETPAGDAAPAEAPAPQLPAAEEILAKAAEAMGGRTAIDAIESFHYRGTIELLGQNIRSDLHIWWQGGDFFMEQIVPGVGEMRAGKQGDEIWSDDPINGRRTLSGVEAEQHTWASSLLLAADWERYFDEAKTIAEREIEGDKGITQVVYDVQLTSKSGLTVTMSFDAETGLQVGQTFEQITPMGKQPFEVRFEDYRDVEGVKIAFRQVIDAKFQQMVQVIDEVELNVEVDASKFAYPRGSSDLVRQPAPQEG